MVRRGHLGPGGVEASAASDLGGRTNGGAGEHLDKRSIGVGLERLSYRNGSDVL